MNTYVDMLGMGICRLEDFHAVEISAPYSARGKAISRLGERYIYRGYLNERSSASSPGEGSRSVGRPSAAELERTKEEPSIEISKFIHETNSQNCEIRRGRTIILHDEDEAEVCTLSIGAVSISPVPVAWAQRFVDVLLNGLIKVAREENTVLSEMLIHEGGVILNDSDWTIAMKRENKAREMAHRDSAA